MTWPFALTVLQILLHFAVQFHIGSILALLSSLPHQVISDELTVILTMYAVENLFGMIAY